MVINKSCYTSCWIKSVAESVSKPLSYWNNNVIGSYNLIKVWKKITVGLCF